MDCFMQVFQVRNTELKFQPMKFDLSVYLHNVMESWLDQQKQV